MKSRCPLILLLIGGGSLIARAQLVEQYTFNSNLALPDGNSTGASDSQLITSSAIPAIGSLTVALDATGDFNGDLYLYLRHESETTPGNFVTDGFAVLLNRVGRTAANPSGYADSGFNITLSDAAANGDVHLYQSISIPAAGAPLSGTWQPDGRNVNPASVLETDARTAMLESFFNVPVNGRWTLFGADVQSGGVTQIDNWGLNITAVPEPSTSATAAGLILLMFGLVRNLQRGNWNTKRNKPLGATTKPTEYPNKASFLLNPDLTI